MTPLARSMRYARETLGWTIDRVEQRVPIPGRNVTRDCFGFIDALAMTGGRIVGIQATSSRGVPEHKRKIEGEPRAYEWLESGGHLELWGWAKRKLKPGGKAMRWRLRRIVCTLDESADALRWIED